MKLKRIWGNYFVKIIALAAIYAITGQISVYFDFPRGFLAPVWIPSGISVAFLYFYGLRYWPGILIGSTIIDIVIDGQLLVGLGAASGAVLQGLIGAHLLRYFSFDRRLARLSDITLLLFVAFLTGTISAITGTLSLYAGKIVDNKQLYFTFVNWLGNNAIGTIVIGFFIFVLSSKFVVEKGRWRVLEALAATTLFFWITFYFFLGLPSARAEFSISYFIFPTLLWIAIRFGQLGAVLASVALSAVGIWATAAGHGPFATLTIGDNLLQFQLFLAVTCVTTLVVAALATQTREAIQVRDEFLSIASHELKTPLTSLQLHLHLLSRLTKPDPAPSLNLEKLGSILDKAGTQVGRITTLVNDLLDVTRIQAGVLTFKFEKVNLLTLTKEVLERFSEQLEMANCTLNVNIDNNIWGFWDPMKIEQVLVNLVTNAIKYAPGNPISITATQEGQNVSLAIQDSGPGIDKESQEKIFDRFERVTTSHNIGGLGLGLFITRQITEAHHGRIHVVSELGKGAKFILDLPLNPAHSMAD